MKFLLYVCFALKISLILAIKWQGNSNDYHYIFILLIKIKLNKGNLNDFPTGWGVKKISNPNL